MFRATDNRWVGLFTNDVKRMTFNEFTGMNLYCDDEWFIQLSDIWKVLEKMGRGDVLLWSMDGVGMKALVGRIADETVVNNIKKIRKLSPNLRLFRIERMTADFDIVELEFNE